MNSIEPAFPLFTLVPIVFFLFYALLVLGFAIFAIIMILRFVKAHERIAERLDTISTSIRSIGQSKEQ